MRSFLIPYGVCNFDKDGVLKNIKEKPSYDFFVNTGLYIIEPKVLKLIPRNVKFDMNELIIKCIDKGIKIGVFPITENSWIDVGQWPEYKKNINNLIN
jgi:NDP-sugar pyrophosphorylase family protein